MANDEHGVKTPKLLSSGEQDSYSKIWGNERFFLPTPIFFLKKCKLICLKIMHFLDLQ